MNSLQTNIFTFYDKKINLSKIRRVDTNHYIFKN